MNESHRGTVGAARGKLRKRGDTGEKWEALEKENNKDGEIFNRVVNLRHVGELKVDHDRLCEQGKKRKKADEERTH